jgi:hypothetical protein
MTLPMISTSQAGAISVQATMGAGTTIRKDIFNVFPYTITERGINLNAFHEKVIIIAA